MAEAYMGMVAAYGLNFTIRNWGSCSGALLTIASNTALFSLLSTYYGGDGRTTFALPDLRGRRAFGAGAAYRLGQFGGRETITLGVDQLPPHTHVAADSVTGGNVDIAPPTSEGPRDSSDPANAYFGAFPQDQYAGTANTTVLMGDYPAPLTQDAPVTSALATAGASSSVFMQSPYLALTYQICMVGAYPSRN